MAGEYLFLTVSSVITGHLTLLGRQTSILLSNKTANIGQMIKSVQGKQTGGNVALQDDWEVYFPAITGEGGRRHTISNFPIFSNCKLILSQI